MRPSFGKIFVQVPASETNDAGSSVLCAIIPAALFAGWGLVALGDHLPLPFIMLELAKIAIIATAAIVAALRWRRPTVACVFAALFAGYILSIFGMSLGYAIFHSGRNFPLIDAELLAADHAMGFDWPRMLAWFNAHPALTHLLGFPYAWCGQQIGVLVLALAITGQGTRLSIFVAANAIALMVVHTVGYFWPAIGAYGALGLSKTVHPDVSLLSEALTVGHVSALRAGGTLVFPSDGLLGLMTFPSYHAAAGVLFAWAFWEVRALGWRHCCSTAASSCPPFRTAAIISPTSSPAVSLPARPSRPPIG